MILGNPTIVDERIWYELSLSIDERINLRKQKVDTPQTRYMFKSSRHCYDPRQPCCIYDTKNDEMRKLFMPIVANEHLHVKSRLLLATRCMKYEIETGSKLKNECVFSIALRRRKIFQVTDIEDAILYIASRWMVVAEEPAYKKFGWLKKTLYRQITLSGPLIEVLKSRQLQLCSIDTSKDKPLRVSFRGYLVWLARLNQRSIWKPW
jgi:hypothetical protein